LEKVYPNEYKSIAFAIFPKNLIITAVRCMALSLAPVVEQYLKALDEAERNDDGQDGNVFPPLPNLKPATVKTAYSILRMTTVMTTRRIMERLLSLGCSERMMWKLMKDIPKSAQRKASNPLLESSRAVSRGCRMARTAVRGYAVVVGADFVVNQCILTTKLVTEVNKLSASTTLSAEAKKAEGRKKWNWLFRQTVYSTSKAIGSLTFLSLACGIVVLIRPKNSPTWAYWITFAGMSIGDLVGDHIVTTCLEDWANAQ